MPVLCQSSFVSLSAASEIAATSVHRRLSRPTAAYSTATKAHMFHMFHVVLQRHSAYSEGVVLISTGWATFQNCELWVHNKVSARPLQLSVSVGSSSAEPAECVIKK